MDKIAHRSRHLADTCRQLGPLAPYPCTVAATAQAQIVPGKRKSANVYSVLPRFAHLCLVPLAAKLFLFAVCTSVASSVYTHTHFIAHAPCFLLLFPHLFYLCAGIYIYRWLCQLVLPIARTYCVAGGRQNILVHVSASGCTGTIACRWETQIQALAVYVSKQLSPTPQTCYIHPLYNLEYMYKQSIYTPLHVKVRRNPKSQHSY